jgi:hypothetical protein
MSVGPDPGAVSTELVELTRGLRDPGRASGGPEGFLR